MLAHFLPALCASVFAAGGCQQDNPAGIRSRPQAEVAPQRDTSLAPIADTYIRQGRPNQNQGAEPILRLESLLKNRSLLRWDQQALAQAVAGGTLTAARLELTIADLRDNWGTAGRTIELHRMTQVWTESGATWNCAVDGAPGNLRADCAGPTAWDMDHGASYPWMATPTATALLRNNQTGVVSFEVTADVRAWLGGQQPNYGWILKKTVEGDPGKVDFGSRESGAGPRLVLSVVSGDSTRPEVPGEGYHRTDADAQQSVQDPLDTGISYYRSLFVVRFVDAASGLTVRAFLSRYQATVVGGNRFVGAYDVRVPDPGPSWAEFDSLFARMRREPGIDFVSPITSRPGTDRIFARLPGDGAGAARGDWLSLDPGPGTWPRLAIREPLAWGCETGEYAATHVRVGVIDYFFDSGHPDLAANVAGTHPIPSGVRLVRSAEMDKPNTRNHGTAVAGVLGAVGDNGLGVAGAMWGVDLHLFEMARDDSVPDDRIDYLAKTVFPGAIQEGIRVTSVSFDVSLGSPDVANQRQKLLKKALQVYVGAGSVFVFGLGNDNVAASLEDWTFGGGSVPDTAFFAFRSAIADLRRSTDAAAASATQRIITVTGTARGGSYWKVSETVGSNFFRGGTDVAAPAGSVLTLGHRQFSSGELVASGTSLSAPFVAGVAAQLLAMDSTLTPAKVKDYIVRGALEPRRSASTGQLEPPTSVHGAPETVYQLDAYGALTLLSRERPATPICGYPVSLALDANGVPTGTEIFLDRPGAPSIIAVPGAHSISGLSVAQGGRLLSVYDGDENGVTQSILFDQRGRPLGTVPDVQRTFLENSTVDVLFPWTAGRTLPWPTYIRRGATVDTLDLVRDVVPPGDLPYVMDGGAWIAPAGDAAVVWYAAGVNDQCVPYINPEIVRWMLVPLAGGTPTPIGEIRYCGIWNGTWWDSWPYGTTWSHDSRRATLLSWRGDYPLGEPIRIEGKLTTVLASGTARGDSLADVVFMGAVYLPDDSLLRVTEAVRNGGCDVVLRSAENPGLVVSRTPGNYAFDCLGWVPIIPNAPPIVPSGTGVGASGGVSAFGRTGFFSLSAPADRLGRRVGGFGWSRILPQRVQVN